MDSQLTSRYSTNENAPSKGYNYRLSRAYQCLEKALVVNKLFTHQSETPSYNQAG